MYVHTCIKCQTVRLSTVNTGRCPNCNGERYVETVEERDKRLGITRSDIHSWVITDQLKGTIYEKIGG